MSNINNTFRSFGSDNNSGVHPNVLEAVIAANHHHSIGYGDDPWTRETDTLFKLLFGSDCSSFLVFNGTGANTVAIQACTESHNAIIVTETAHILVDECGAPFKMSGTIPIIIPGKEGKLTPANILPRLNGQGIVHHSQAKVIYISQSTELGTVYQPDEILELTSFAHKHNMYVVMDGARLANACVYLGMSMKEITVDLGVDLLSFGGTKNGMMMGECVVNFRPELNEKLAYVRKQSTQLASKMRYLAAQYPAYFNNDLYLENARHANLMAKKLENACLDLGYKTAYPVEANAVFMHLPKQKIIELQSKFFFYIWDDSKNIVRWVCSWDTSIKDIEELIYSLKS